MCNYRLDRFSLHNGIDYTETFSVMDFSCSVIKFWDVNYDLLITKTSFAERFMYWGIYFFRFIPEYREYLSEIREGLKVRGMGFSIMRPIHSLEIYLVPMIYKAFETGEILTCALITKGIEYDCKKTSYEDLSFTWKDYSVIFIGLIFMGITIWQKI